MHKRLIFITLFLLISTASAQAGMLRVTGVLDERTLIVAGTTQTRISLAGIVITDRASAIRFLTWALDSAWIAGEKRADGYLVWRSPDALFINRELVNRGYARATSAELEPPRNFTVTYLGQIDPPARSHAPALTAKPGSGSGIASRRRGPRSPRARPSPKSRAARNRPSAAPSSEP